MSAQSECEELSDMDWSVSVSSEADQLYCFWLRFSYVTLSWLLHHQLVS